MRNLFFMIGLAFLATSCTQPSENDRAPHFRPPSLLKDYESDFTDYITAPEGYTKLAELTSNLDGDDIPETSVVLESATVVKNRKEREIRIFRKRNGQFVLWQTIKGGVLPNDMNNDFDDDRGELLLDDARVLAVFHHGGPRGDGTRYPQMAHSFQLKDGIWQLESAHIVNSETGGAYDYTIECRFDANTGELVYERTAEFNYDSDSTKLPPKEVRTFSFPLKQPVKLEGFVPGTVCIPGTKTVYL